MARRDTRRKSKADFSLLTRKHKLTNNGAIFEKDLMTISKMDELFSDQVPIYSDSNFKFSIRTGNNVQRKHSRGNWDCPDDLEVLTGETCSWTKDSLANQPNVQTTENKIVLNPDYSSISDFAYYGSAVELFKASVTDIIENFPGELYFTDNGETIDGEDYYKISNPYGIDVDTLGLDVNIVYNKLRYFFDGLLDYVVITNDNVYKLDDCGGTVWTVKQYNPGCLELHESNGTWLSEVSITVSERFVVTMYVRIKDGIKELYYKDLGLQGLRIRPKQAIIENYFNSLNPFERVLLNRESYPIYSSEFETYSRTDKGISSYIQKYTWPSKYGYNPDTDNAGYELYIANMLSLCEFHDEYNTDNIWRKLTHESIKNLDWTFTRYNEDNIDTIDGIDSTRMQAALRLYGRTYDDIKMYIDSVKNSNTISYNGKGNAPDYVFSDILENKGFDAHTLNITNDNTIKTLRLYPGLSNGYTSSEANIEFFRRLALNSNYILRKKGTRDGVETMLKLLGFNEDEFEINEYVVVASGRTDYENFGSVTKEINTTYPLLDNIGYINAYRDAVYYEKDEELVGEDRDLYHLPLKPVYMETADGDEQAYVVPWFDKEKEHDNNLYFQQKGGWGKRIKKTINLSIAPNVTELTSSNLLSIYGETIPPLNFARDLEELTNLTEKGVVSGSVCYVTDLSDLMDVYHFKDDAEKQRFMDNEYSHYFVLTNSALTTFIGYYTSTTVDGIDEYGWKNIYTEEFDTTNDQLTENGKKVIYYESIVENTEGNNPHISHDSYDEGDSYVEAMTLPFKYAAETENFSWFDDEDVEKFKDYGFSSTWYKDNKKCWYFTDSNYGESGLVRKATEQDLKNAENYYNNLIQDLKK